MDERLVNLATEKYWAFLVLVLIVYIPIAGDQLRRWVAAALNLVFLKLYMGKVQLAVILAATLVIFAVTRLLVRPGFRTLACVFLAVPTLALFILHKFPGMAFIDPSHRVINVLATIGFSYVALRIADLLLTVHEGRSAPPSLPDTINYLLPFHMLAAGPIQAYSNFVEQSGPKPSLTSVQALRAIERIAFGVFKKYVLAMILQQVFLTGFTIPGWYIVWEAQIFYVWLYLDFSALSDIAVGIGALIGTATPENFNRPFVSRNLIEFWERWHISLSQFIRRSLFIPIQLWMVRWTGGAHPILCASVALTIAFSACGLWHQGTFRFLLWGLGHALGLIVNNIYRDQLIKRFGSKGVKQYLANPWVRIAASILTFEFVAFSLVFVAIPSKTLFQ